MRRIHIFKAGKHASTSGQQFAFSESDLAATAAAYDPALHEAPLVVGHPQLDGPAYGWTKSLGLTADGLFAQPHEVQPAFSELVAAKAYKKISAKFYAPEDPANPVPGVYYLRHIGFLGAQPPAIKGLKPIEFASEAGGIEFEIEFAESTPESPPQQPPEPSSLPPESEPAKSAPDGSPEGFAPTPPETTAVTPEEAAALKAQNEALAADLAAARSTLQAQASAASTAAHTAFAESLIAQARIAPADKALVVATLDHLEPAVLPGAQAPAVVEFGEGEAKKPMAEALKGWLQGLPKRVEFSEQASRERAAGDKPAQGDSVTYAEGTPTEAIELDKRIRAFATEHKLGYAEAAQNVAMQDARARR